MNAKEYQNEREAKQKNITRHGLNAFWRTQSSGARYTKSHNTQHQPFGKITCSKHTVTPTPTETQRFVWKKEIIVK